MVFFTGCTKEKDIITNTDTSTYVEVDTLHSVKDTIVTLWSLRPSFPADSVEIQFTVNIPVPYSIYVITKDSVFVAMVAYGMSHVGENYIYWHPKKGSWNNTTTYICVEQIGTKQYWDYH